jgi:hypothetical protein
MMRKAIAFITIFFEKLYHFLLHIQFIANQKQYYYEKIIFLISDIHVPGPGLM